MSVTRKAVRPDMNKPDDRTNRQRWMMAGIVGAAILTAATGAQAGEGHWKHGWSHGRGYYAPYYRGYYAPYYYAPYVTVPTGHVRYYAPPPVVVYPAPAVYAPTYPIYDGPAYPSLNLGVNIPLR
jgi:hypothetical protein